MKPIYSITIGSLKLSNQNANQGGILGISISSEVNLINEAKLILPAELEVSIELDDEVTIALGESKPTTVFMGVVNKVTLKLDQIIIHVTSRVAALTAHHRNALYEQQTCGDIAEDLVGAFEVSLGEIDKGLEYPVYIVDSSCSVYHHLLELASQNGLYLYSDSEDQFCMTAPIIGMTHLLAYGKNIIAFEYEELLENVAGVDVYGESPLSHGEGKEAYSWFGSKEVLGSAGSKKGSVQYLANPALKDMDSAQLVADNTLSQLATGGKVKIKVLGNPNVKLLDQLLIKEIPGNISGRYECHGIKHNYEKGFGFVTHITGQEVQNG